MPADSELIAFGREVRRLRRARKLSQEKLAAAAELHRNYVGGVERGERNAGVKAILALARALGASPAEFFPTSDEADQC